MIIIVSIFSVFLIVAMYLTVVTIKNGIQAMKYKMWGTVALSCLFTLIDIGAILFLSGLIFVGVKSLI